ncbi:hypothetical protein IKB17_05075 [bacterium]|nr:hypothetical protein [bacterium]
MQINNSTNYNYNFKAIKIAKVSNVCVDNAVVDIYKITKNDKKFLEKLEQKIDYKSLFPKLDDYSIDRWQNIFRYCISQILEGYNTSYIAFFNKKPCGLLTSVQEGNDLYLDGICSIPVEINKKFNGIGKILFFQFFKDFQKNKCKTASLSAVNNGPFNVVKKYEKLGFVKDPCSFPYSKMVCNKFKIQTQLQNLEKEFEYQEQEPVITDLTQFIN